jgi:hypothetical protein
VNDLRFAIEGTVLIEVQVSPEIRQVTKLVERDDVGDFSGSFSWATDD